ncbi:MAG: 30S ribosomal protein S13 [Parachlamydiales bacterium]
MPRVVGVDIPNKKKLKVSLTYIHGIGPALSKQITDRLNLDPERRAEELNSEEIGRINTLLQEEYVVEGYKRRAVQGDIKRLQSIGSYRGQRHRLGLPCRGQGTQNNARTRKGKKKTVAGKKK